MGASSSPAGVSWLYYANRLYELPLGVVSIATAAVMVPSIAASVRARDDLAIARTQSRAFELALGISLPATLALALLAGEIAGGLFERGAFGPADTAAVAAAVAAICGGLPGHALEKVFGAIFFAHDNTRLPMLAAFAGLASALAAATALFPAYGHVGVAAAIALSGWVGTAVLGLALLRRRWLHGDRELARRMACIVLSAVTMGAVLVVVKFLLHEAFGQAASALGRIAVLVVLVPTGLAVYLGALHLLAVIPIASLRDVIRRQL
jgi:putative peptidoglycan lipid II flippase